MKKIIKTKLSIFLLVIAGCQMTLDVPIPESEIRPTALCILNSYSPTPAMQMAYTKPLFNATNTNQEFDFIPGVSIQINNGNNVFNFIEDTRKEMYLSNEEIRLNPGENYQLDITLKDGRKMTASQTVPEPIEDFEFSIEQNEDEFGFSQNYLRYKIKINPNKKIYIGLSGFIDIEPVEEDQTFPLNFGSRFITNDNAVNGYATGRVPIWTFVDYEDSYQYAIITSLTEELYRYYRSTDFDLNSITPFSEPAPIYTNITGGLGIFGIQYQQVILID